ncbi:MAG TPA: hypothetical protein VGD77_08480 [Gemmatimonadaceae bacterium]
MSTPDSRLDLAVARGIITAEQREGILALETEGRPSADVLRGEVTGVTIAYYAGAAAILFAFGWFLADRWKVLGPGGVLAVAVAYAALFLVVARWLEREGFPVARGLMVLAAVGMTPIAAWAVLELAGVWTPKLGSEPWFPGWRRDWESLRWIPIELATALSALVALRRVRFGLLVLPLPVVAWSVCAQLVQVAFDPPVMGAMQGWMAFVVAATLATAGYALDRRTAGETEDYAWPVYAVAVAAVMFGMMVTWPELHHGRHALLALGVVLAGAALTLRRRVFLVGAALAFAVYVGWLGFSVFRRALGFPIALATVGLVIILAAVWVQRRFPGLGARATRRVGDPPRLPGGWTLPAGAIAVSLALFAVAPGWARERARDREIRERVLMLRRANERRLAERAKADSVKRGIPAAGASRGRGGPPK